MRRKRKKWAVNSHPPEGALKHTHNQEEVSALPLRTVPPHALVSFCYSQTRPYIPAHFVTQKWHCLLLLMHLNQAMIVYK